MKAGILAFVALIIVGSLSYYFGREQGSKEEKLKKQQDASAERAKQPWASVTNVLQLSPDETLRQIVIRDDQSALFDTKCLLYSDSKTFSTTIRCEHHD